MNTEANKAKDKPWSVRCFEVAETRRLLEVIDHNLPRTTLYEFTSQSHMVKTIFFLRNPNNKSGLGLGLTMMFTNV